MFEYTVGFWTVYFTIGIFVLSRNNWTDRSSPFITEYIGALVALLLWPMALVISNRT